jgi:hypothetical protein
MDFWQLKGNLKLEEKSDEEEKIKEKLCLEGNLVINFIIKNN